MLHVYAFWVALVAAAVLIATASAGRATAASVVYGGALCALFAVSGLYHRWRWDGRWRLLLRRLDHSTIFVFIAASCTPLALLVLSNPARDAVLLCVWFGAAAGVAMSVAWIGAPRVLVASAYVAVGAAAVIAIPGVVDRLPLAPELLLGAGALLYVLGAVVYATRRPNPWPRTFGFHELFHGLVVAAAALHFTAMLGWIVPTGA